MTQEQFYLNKIGRGCYKLPERPKPLEPENNNYLPGCVLRPTHSEYLIQENMLSEFSTPEQLAEVRSNLGITPLLEELNRQLDERVLTTQRAVVEQTLTDNENRVLSSHGLYLILQQYYTKNDLDSLTTKINELIANLIIVDSELSNKSTNPVLNKVLTDAINGIYEVIVNRIINPRKKDDGMGYNSYISVREELEAKVNLTELENFYNKEQVDAIKQNLQSQIDEAKNISNTVIELVQTAEYLERLKSIIFDDLTELIPTKVSDLENDSQYVTSSEVSSEVSSAVNTAVSSLVNGAPEALDTLKEIADKLGDNDDAVAGLINQITEETSRAKTAENTLSTALNNEISRAQAAEKVNSDNINALNTALSDEISRARDAEANISDLATVATSGDYKDLKNVPVIEDNPGNREYVEIAGIKWATMNVGATSETDYGLYFQWGDTQGYASSEVGSDSGKKAFKWTDYKYGNGTSSPGDTGMTKYNSTDGKTVLDLKDDAVRANWGGQWRMPTTEELQALGNAVTKAWTTNYNDSGVNGILCTDKTDSSKTLFFPAAGYAHYGSMSGIGNEGFVWSSSLNSNSVSNAWHLYFNMSSTYWDHKKYRYGGFAVRGVLDTTSINKLHKVAESGDYNDLENTPTDVSHFNNDAEYVTESELAPVAKSGSYTDLEDKPTIPAAQILSDWNLTDTSSKDYIKNKPTNVSLFTNDANYITKEELNNTEEVVAAALNDLNTNKADKTEVFPVKATYEEMIEMRDLEKFIPGLYYQITDYVTTVNELLNPNVRSAGHQFDILVRADSVNTLNEQAWAIRHEGDTYFKDARLEAWELKYRLDNVQWSKQTGTYVTEDENGYTFLVIGDITLSGHTYKLLQGFGMYIEDWSDYALMDPVEEGKPIYYCYGDPEEFDPEEPEGVGTASGVEEVTEAGRGTITWMKDEWGNECPYDFKNVQFKRWKVTDELSRSSLDGKYLGVLNSLPAKLSIEDESDFIWAYLYSVYNYAGGTQDTTDHSLTGKVHEMFTNFTVDSNNAFVWGNDSFEAYKCTFSGYVWYNTFSGSVTQCSFSGDVERCSFSGNVYRNTFSGSVQNNTFSGYVDSCSFSGSVENCSFSGYVDSCSFSGYVDSCSFSRNVQNNTFSGYVRNSTFSGNVQNNTFSGSVQNNSFSGNLQNSIISGQLNNLHINASSGVSDIINCLYTLGKIDDKTITVLTNAAYPTYAAMTTAGQLKTWNPADFQTKSELDNNYVNESLLWTGTQAEYNAIPNSNKSDTTIYIITES